ASPRPPLFPYTTLFRSRRASEAVAAGDYREAVRLAYWAGVYRLEELGQWRVERTRTHREYLRMLPRESSRHAPLAAITERFEMEIGRSTRLNSSHQIIS